MNNKHTYPAISKNYFYAERLTTQSPLPLLNPNLKYRNPASDLHKPAKNQTASLTQKRSENPFSWKTLLFLPQFAFEKSAQTDADCFIVDFQDAVPLPMKATVREGLKAALKKEHLGDRPIVVRINENAVKEEQILDLDTIVGLKGITALMPTMIERPEELDELHEILLIREINAGIPAGSTKLLPLIETPAAVLRVDAIAQSGGGRIIGLFLGHGDLFRLSGATPHDTSTMDFPRNAVLFAARAAGIAAFDTPYTKVSDIIGLEREAKQAKRHGFDGKACIHSHQVSLVKRCMLPSTEELTWAKKVEQARKEGQLETLSKKICKEKISDKINRQTDGMALVDGQLIGPPHIKASQRILHISGNDQQSFTGRKGRVIAHKSETEINQHAVMSNPYELTITEGMLDLWLQSFYTHDPSSTSRQYAKLLGKCSGNQMPVPFMMALYLCVSMSETHGAIFHLGFRNARMLKPIQTGNTVRQKITMLRVRNTEDGKRAVVTTLRELITVDTNEVVFRTEKLELYPKQEKECGGEEIAGTIYTEINENDELLQKAIKGFNLALKQRNQWEGYHLSKLEVEQGDVLLHSFARPLGITANLALSTRFLVTHPIHLDHRRFDQGEGSGIVVSGGLVISLILGAVSRDFSHVLWEELISANNIKPVSPNETISAFSVVIDRKTLPENELLEVLLVKSIGVKNISPANDMTDMILPDELLKPMVGGGSKYDEICKRLNIPALEGKIVGEVLRKIVRVKPF
jgi:citrate lyase beta subunit/acyl dehydratase